MRTGAERPRTLFSIDYKHSALHAKDVMPDGKKFLMVGKSREKPPAAKLTVITDWQAKAGK